MKQNRINIAVPRFPEAGSLRWFGAIAGSAGKARAQARQADRRMRRRKALGYKHVQPKWTRPIREIYGRTVRTARSIRASPPNAWGIAVPIFAGKQGPQGLVLGVREDLTIRLECLSNSAS